MIPKAFITGSHAYGTPHGGSDIDLVVMLEEEEVELLLNHAGCEPGSTGNEEKAHTRSVRYGGLNLLLPLSEESHHCWWNTTQKLIERKPVTRDEAVMTFIAARCAAGLEKRKPVRLEDVKTLLEKDE